MDPQSPAKSRQSLAGHVLVLAVLIAGSVAFKVFAEKSFVHPNQEYDAIVRETIQTHPWKLLLPMPVDRHGEGRWTTTGFALASLLSQGLGKAIALVRDDGEILGYYAAYLLLSSALIVVSYVGAWIVLRSWVFSCTLGFLMAFGTQFNYIYCISAVILFYPFVIYLEICLVALYFLMVRRPKNARWKVLFIGSLVCMAMCYEMWLDFALFLLVSMVYLFFWSRRHGLAYQRKQARFVFIATLGVMIAYLAVRIPYAGQFVSSGREAELVFTYPHVIMAVEDVIANVFLYVYTSLTNYFPSFLVASNSLCWYGEQALIAEQHGFHPDFSHLAPMHHLYLWRFYAGAMLVLFVFLLIKCLRGSFRRKSHHFLAVSLFCILIATGFSTHALIKFRPYLSVPTWSYKCIVSIVGVSLLISYLVMLARDKYEPKRRYSLIVIAVWFVVFVAAITRPTMQVQLHPRVGMVGPPKEPLRRMGIVKQTQSP